MSLSCSLFLSLFCVGKWQGRLRFLKGIQALVRVSMSNEYLKIRRNQLNGFDFSSGTDQTVLVLILILVPNIKKSVKLILVSILKIKPETKTENML